MAFRFCGRRCSRGNLRFFLLACLGLQLTLPFSSSVCAYVPATAHFVGGQSTTPNFFVSAGAAYFEASNELGYREGLLGHAQPFLGYWPSVFACGMQLFP